SPAHPLDRLSSAELADSVKVLRDTRKLGDSFRFASCSLLEPTRQVILEHKPDRAVPRQAFLVLLDNSTGTAYEAVVDLEGKKVVRFDALPAGVHPSIMLDEFTECEKAVKDSPEFRASLQKRGVEDVDLVMVEPWSAGNYGTEAPEHKGR